MNEPKKKALKKALDLLSKRSYSKQILKGKLLEKEFAEDDVDAAIKKLEELGFLDDKKYAQNLAREYLEFRRYGAYRVKLKLKEKKISDEIIKEVIGGLSEATEKENLDELAKKYLAKNRTLSREKIYNRALGYLLRRGYSYSKCRDVIKKNLLRG